jgi:serpin B
MIRSTVALLSLGIALVMNQPADARSEIAPSIEVEKAAARSSNRFALDLYAKVRGEPGNLVFSPLSVIVALGMTQDGARGATRRQMQTVLHWHEDASHKRAAQFLVTRLRRGGEQGGPELHIANALWVKSGFPVSPDFLAFIEQSWGARLEQLDFNKRAAAAKTINHWVEKQTRDRIKDLISPDHFDAMTRLVLTNAVYFKGSWLSPFEADATRDAEFMTGEGTTVTVKTMHQSAHFGYAENAECQVLEMPYDNSDLGMAFVLPRQREGLAKLEASLSEERLAAWLGAVQTREVVVSLPRFTMTRGVELAAALKSLGMTDAFDMKKADFTGIATHEPLFISAAIHKAFVRVDEQGTEAAAATAIAMAATAAPMGEPPPVFRADHPFLFLIRDRQNGAILFMGRVTDPSR